jgi:hypothetical protein
VRVTPITVCSNWQLLKQSYASIIPRYTMWPDGFPPPKWNAHFACYKTVTNKLIDSFVKNYCLLFMDQLSFCSTRFPLSLHWKRKQKAHGPRGSWLIFQQNDYWHANNELCFFTWKYKRKSFVLPSFKNHDLEQRQTIYNFIYIRLYFLVKINMYFTLFWIYH